MKQIVTLSNLSCQHCADRVMKSFQNLEGITKVVVDLSSEIAKVTSDNIYRLEDYQASLSSTRYVVKQVQTVE